MRPTCAYIDWVVQIDPSLGSILPSANYQIRINLLGRNQVRDESDTYLKQFDEGTAKAAFLN